MDSTPEPPSLPEARVRLRPLWFLRDGPFLARCGGALEMFAITVSLTLLMEREASRTPPDLTFARIAAFASFFVAIAFWVSALWRAMRMKVGLVASVSLHPFRFMIVCVLGWSLPFFLLVAAAQVPFTARAWLAALILVIGLVCTFGPKGTRRLMD